MKVFFTSRFSTIGDFLASQHFHFADLKNLFLWSYWSEANIPTTSPYLLATIIGLIILVGLLIFWRQRIRQAQAIAPIYQSSLNHLSNIIAFIIIVVISYLFFRWQAINYLSSRLVILTTLLIVIAWLGRVIYYQTRQAPTKEREHLERERFFRYIPKGKPKLSTNSKRK